TGLKVTNQDEKTPTTVSAKDEDGNDVKVTIDPETGAIKVTPGENVDGPIKVTVKDDDFIVGTNPTGEITRTIEVEGHEKDKDDNGSDLREKDIYKVTTKDVNKK